MVEVQRIELTEKERKLRIEDVEAWSDNIMKLMEQGFFVAALGATIYRETK